jgi:hypothetical protein
MLLLRVDFVTEAACTADFDALHNGQVNQRASRRQLRNPAFRRVVWLLARVFASVSGVERPVFSVPHDDV